MPGITFHGLPRAYIYAQETGRLLAVTTHPFLAGAVLAVVVAIAKEIF